MESMAEATDEATPPHHGLPDAIVIWEILVRLPPKPLLRCRAVCPATSTRDFLLAHHARQPTLPLLLHRTHKSSPADIISFDHRAADDKHKLQPVARLDAGLFHVMDSCDGLLVIADHNKRFSICNPATREYAPLRQLDEFTHDLTLLGMYPHSPTGEYRLLAKLTTAETQDLLLHDYSYYAIFTLGSRPEPPRTIIGCPDDEWEIHSISAAMLHGAMHWFAGQMIMVFDTTAESFRQMPSPVASVDADLFETAGMLAMSIFNERQAILDIWMMRDYQGEVWALKHKVQVPVAELNAQFGMYTEQWRVLFPSCWNGQVFGLFIFGHWLLQIDIHGKLVASFHRRHELIRVTPFCLQQTLVPHSFFPTLEGYVVNNSPFI